MFYIEKMARKGKQGKFAFISESTQHGGSVGLGKRKTIRPVATKRAMHVVLRSSRARGDLSLLTLRNQKHLRKVLNQVQSKFAVKVSSMANVGNHLHLVTKAKTQDDFKNFLRTLTALLARFVTGARKGDPKGKFWDGLAFTKVIEWGKHYQNLSNYIEINQLEAMGWIDRAVQKATGRVILRPGWG